MKDELDDMGVPPPDAGASGPAPAPLGDWRGPAFWMACGALLAGLAVGAVVVAQRVGVERDMAAVAMTLPPRASDLTEPPRPGAFGSSAAHGDPMTPAGPGAATGATRARDEAAARATAPMGRVGEAGTKAPGAIGRGASRPVGAHQRRLAAGAAPGKAATGATAQRHGGGRALADAATVRKAVRMHKGEAAAATKSRPRPLQRRQRALDPDKYAEVFKRCPPPGQSGSVECRRHICDGAEGKGPACKPYRRKQY